MEARWGIAEAFESIEGIAHEKASILDGLVPGGVARLSLGPAPQRPRVQVRQGDADVPVLVVGDAIEWTAVLGIPLAAAVGSAHATLLAWMADPTATPALQQAAWRHSRETHAALLRHVAQHGPQADVVRLLQASHPQPGTRTH